MKPDRQPWGARLGVRILLAAVLVLGVGALTAWAVAFAVGPAIFHEHMLMVENSDPDPEVVKHAEEAFDASWQLSLLLALIAACLASVLVSVVLARRITATLNKVRSAAIRVAHGDYGARVPEGAMGAEFTEMISAFNRMASELDETEHTRKQLLSDLAHEMRTPVATVDGYLEAMLDGVAAADSETLTMLREQTDRLKRLSADVSLVSSAEEHRLSMETHVISVADLISVAQGQARSSYAAQDVALQIVQESDGARVLGDRDRLSQVLTNLLDNALRHTEPGDQVILRAGSDSETVFLSVEDTGHGVASEHLSHLFERFYRVDTARDRAHGGSGIGLAIVRSIVEAHGGNVRAESDGLGHGALFTVGLPRHN